MSKKTKDSLKTVFYIMFPAAGVLLMLMYVKFAGADVIYSDYIRIVASYLPDVANPAKFLVPDILTRIPATFLARFINVGTFGYSVVFDRVLGIAGLGVMAVVVVRYFYLHDIGFGWQLVLFAVLFSLIKWEILLNGTAWAHLVSFGLFFINYLLLGKLWKGETNPREEFLLCLFPFFLLLFAGEYIASYAVTMILFGTIGVLMGGVGSWDTKRTQKIFGMVLVCTVISLSLYLLSRSFAVWEYSGATDMSFIEAFGADPLYFVVFFFKSFAGAFLGQETIASFFSDGTRLPDYTIIVLGVMIFLGYLLAFYLYFRSELFEESIFPMILLISGLLNHFLVCFARWIFMDSDYALSSRYSSQYMIGIIGMILIFAMYPSRVRALKRMPRRTRAALKFATAGLVVLIVAGNCYTSWQEIGKARYREDNFTVMYGMVANYRDYSAEELRTALEWTKDDETMYEALEILEENRLNVFRGR